MEGRISFQTYGACHAYSNNFITVGQMRTYVFTVSKAAVKLYACACAPQPSAAGAGIACWQHCHAYNRPRACATLPLAARSNPRPTVANSGRARFVGCARPRRYRDGVLMGTSAGHSHHGRCSIPQVTRKRLPGLQSTHSGNVDPYLM